MIKRNLKEAELLIKSVPSIIFVLFILTIFSMNLLANKSINLPFTWLALDCGMIISWFAFLTMDILTHHFGPKAATMVSVMGTMLNLLMCFIFFVVSKIPGMWGEAHIAGSEDIINIALNKTFGGTWYVIFGSTAAFIASAIVNNFVNFAVGRATKKEKSFSGYIIKSWISTIAGQFADNFIFSILVSRLFFGWSLLQCVSCATTGVLIELFCEMLFSRMGYKICEKWEKENVGKEYLDYIKSGEVK